MFGKYRDLEFVAFSTRRSPAAQQQGAARQYRASRNCHWVPLLQPFLEKKLRCQLSLARTVSRGADHTEGRGSEQESRIPEPHVIQRVEELGPDLQVETAFQTEAIV